MDFFRIILRISPGAVLLLLTLGLAGCASGPDQDGKGVLPAADGSLDQSKVLRGFRRDQEKRHQLPTWWRVSGHVEMKFKDDNRRYRMELVGKRGDFIRMIVFGPFKNAVMALTMDSEWLQLVNSTDRAILEVAADSRGMEALTGMAFNPAWMQSALMGCVAALDDGSASLEGAVLSGVNGVGEKIWVDATSGLLKQRSRQAGEGKHFFVDYGWPEDQAPAGQLSMPERVDIRLDDDSRLTMYLKVWNFYSSRPKDFPDQTQLPAFPTLYPEIGDGIAP